MARIEFSADPTHPPKRPRPQPPPPSGRDETRKSVDYISELPDVVILHIFSFLDTKDAMKTSVLSKRWRSTWTANPRISFSLPLCNHSLMFHCSQAFVDAVLSRCTANKVKSFVLDAPFTFRHSRIRRWLQFAVEHHVEEVSMILPNHTIYALPRFFFRCTTLVSFHVSRCRFPEIDAVNWRSLKRLRIINGELDDNAMMRVLSGCPVLEFFELQDCWGFDHIKVESRSLRELVIDSHKFRRRQILKISAPHLLELRLLGNNVEGEFEVDKVSSLVEAELNFNVTTPREAQARGDLVKTLLQNLHHVTKLVMGSWHLQVLSSTEARGVFHPSLQCRHLMFHLAADYRGAPGIAKILESSPRLEKLFLQMTCTSSQPPIVENFGRYNFDAEEFWNSVKQRIYPCVMHLKNVEIFDPGADWVAWEPVLSLLKFLLQNAPLLDKIEINSNNSKRSNTIDSWVLLEVVQIILSHPNRSPGLKVILSYPSQRGPSTSVLKF